MAEDCKVWSLRLLGGAVLECDGEPITGRAAHKRRLALLAFLAASPSETVAREKILGLLWPDHSSARGRALLSESLYVIRKEVGENAFVTPGDDVGLNRVALRSDLAAFREAAQQAQWVRAAEVYRGPFLDGFYLSGAPEFEHWVDGERARLARLHADGLERLAETCEQAGDFTGAVQWYRRLAVLDPLNTRHALYLMRALSATGERAAALRHAEVHGTLLREELGAEPAPDVLALAEQLRREPDAVQLLRAPAAAPATRGDPPPPAVGVDKVEPAVPAVPVVVAPVPAPTLPRRRSRAPGPLLTAAVVAAVLLVGVGLALWLGREAVATSEAERTAEPPRIAVLPFADYSPHGELDYLAVALTTTLIHQLAQVEAFHVVSAGETRPFQDAALPPDSVGRALRAQFVAGGTVYTSNDVVRVQLQLIDARTGETVYSQIQQRPSGELFSLVDDVVTDATEALRVELGRKFRVRRWQAQTQSEKAWQRVQQAVLLRDETRGALRRGTNVVPPAALLDRADSLLAEAEQLDPNWAEPLVLRGWNAYRRGFFAFRPPRPDTAATRQWFRQSIRLADRALRNNPNHPPALELRGIARNRMRVFVPPPDAAEVERQTRLAERDLRGAVEQDPLRPQAWSELSALYTQAGNYAAALHAAERAYTADAYMDDAQQVVHRLFRASFELQRDEEAIHWCEETRRRSFSGFEYAECALLLMAWSPEVKPDVAAAWQRLRDAEAADPAPLFAAVEARLHGQVAAVLARAGLPDSARQVLRRAGARNARVGAPPDLLLPTEAATLSLLGDTAQAVTLLTAYVSRNPDAGAGAIRSRVFTPLQPNPRYQQLARRLAPP